METADRDFQSPNQAPETGPGPLHPPARKEAWTTPALIPLAGGNTDGKADYAFSETTTFGGTLAGHS